VVWESIQRLHDQEIATAVTATGTIGRGAWPKKLDQECPFGWQKKLWFGENKISDEKLKIDSYHY
jgi:hypothetical protein